MTPDDASNIMTPQEKAAKGLELLKESILAYLEQHGGGVKNCQIARELGLQAEPDRFTRTLSWVLLELLLREQRIRTTGRRSTRLFFPV